MTKRHGFSVALLLATIAGCVGTPPPAPVLTVTSPARGLVQGDAGKVTVTGTAMPPASGEPVTQVLVNKTPATLAADGSFSAVVDVPAGVILLETTAITEAGGSATDARAVQVGQLRPVGTPVDRAITATLSADAFAKLSVAAGGILKSLDLMTVLGSQQPIARLGNDVANADVSITSLTFGDVKIALTPVAGGLRFAAEIDTLAGAANVHYDGALIVEGTTKVNVTADKITLGGTLSLDPSGTAGFTTTLASPVLTPTNLVLHADGSLLGSIINLVNDNLSSTIQSTLQSTIEGALGPVMNQALGALSAPQHLDVLGQQLDLQVSPSAIAFTDAGALVTMNVQAKIAGSDASPGYIFTPNGTPTLDVGKGVQLAIADDLVNQLLAQVHARGLLDLHIAGDYDVFDAIDFKLTLPPMISANTSDGSLRLVLGDMIVKVSDHGEPLFTAAINASVDLAVQRGGDAQQIALVFGNIDVFVNPLDGAGEGVDLSGAATQGIGVQLKSLSQFLVNVPVPSVAGLTLDSLSLRGDHGYVVAAGEIH